MKVGDLVRYVGDVPNPTDAHSGVGIVVRVSMTKKGKACRVLWPSGSFTNPQSHMAIYCEGLQ